VARPVYLKITLFHYLIVPRQSHGGGGILPLTMNIILYMGKSCKSYLRWHGQKQPQLVFTCENDVFKCRILHKHGRYFRTAVTKHQTFRIPIYRWYCPECGQTLSVLPDFLVPGVHFVISVREAALKRKEQGAGFGSIAAEIVSGAAGNVSPKTVKRWWNRHLQRAGDAAQWIAGELIRAGIIFTV
jgi:hypothetical protein